MSSIYLDHSLEGISTQDVGELDMLNLEIVTEEHIIKALKMKAVVLAEIRLAIERRDFALLDGLESCYDELLEHIEKLTEDWPADYLPSILDECHFR